MVIGCLTLARMGDIHGRKKVFLIGMGCQVMATLGLLLSTSEIIDYMLLLILGWSITGKQYVGYTYLLELQPKDKQVMAGTAEFMFEALAYFSVCAFFYWVSKQWHYVMLPTIGLAVLGALMSWRFLPESPRFLASTNRFD